jgi:hypothetical protein
VRQTKRSFTETEDARRAKRTSSPLPTAAGPGKLRASLVGAGDLRGSLAAADSPYCASPGQIVQALRKLAATDAR